MVCSQCQQKGKKAKKITLTSLLKPEIHSLIGEENYFFCATPECGTVYYPEDGTHLFSNLDMSISVGIKNCATPRYICYCFKHTMEEIDEEVLHFGSSAVFSKIKNAMKNGCSCTTLNPQGSCCLGTVNQYIKNSIKKHGAKSASNLEENIKDCCIKKGKNYGEQNLTQKA